MKKDFSLGHWFVSFAEGTIRSADETKHIEPKALSVLMTLAEADGQVVSREKLLETVWPNQVVGEDVINSNIASLRKALGDDRKANQYIQTVPKKGYKLVRDVQWAQPNKNKSAVHSLGNGKINKRLLLVLALILLTIVVVIIQQSQQNTLPSEDDYSIAVLPLKTFSSDPEIVYFADGLAEEMLHQLVTNPKLKVMSRSASFHYKNSGKDLSLIAKELNVKYIIEGSVRVHNDEYRITVQLINARNNFHLWSRVFDDSTGELFKIQQQVSIAVSNMLNISDSYKVMTNSRRHPESEQAYRYFVMAQSYMKVATVKSYEEALTLFNKAIELSPEYALAYTGKATSYLLLYQYKHLDMDTALAEAENALEKAHQLDPDQAELYATKGLMYTYLKQYDKAEEHYIKALDLNPNLRLAHHNYSFMLWHQSRFKQAVEHGEIALSTDPLSLKTYFIMGDSLASLAEFDKAITLYQHCQKVLPDTSSCDLGLANLYQIIGELDKTKSNLEKSKPTKPGNFWYNNTYASYLIHVGNNDAAARLLDVSRKQIPSEYFLLRTRWLLALAQNTIPDYIDSIQQLSLKFPDDMDVLKFQAFGAYWNQDYDLAVKLYEKVLRDSPQFMFNLWDYSDGLSHGINLAVSYEKTGNHEMKQKLLMQIEQHLNSLPEQFKRLSGGSYIKAQYYLMVGNHEKSEQILLQLNENWALMWLIQKDPFWIVLPAN